MFRQQYGQLPRAVRSAGKTQLLLQPRRAAEPVAPRGGLCVRAFYRLLLGVTKGTWQSLL